MSRKYLAHYLGCGRHWKRPTYGWICSKDIPSDLKHFPLVEKAGVTSTHNAALWGPSQFPFQTPCDKKKSKHKIPSSIARAAAF
jgi:hypothetical protein